MPDRTHDTVKRAKITSHQGDIRIGVSGWTYPPWRGHFYPKGLVQKRELAFAASRFPALEINGTFYGLQRPESYLRWAEATPEDFVFAVKGSRFITHTKRLRDIEIPLANFLASGLLCLGPKLGPLLWQFPPSFRFDSALLREFLDCCRKTLRRLHALHGATMGRSRGGPRRRPMRTARCAMPSRSAMRVSARRHS